MDTLVLGLRVLLALACVIGLIWVLARRAGWGKGRRRPAGPAVELVGRQALGRHAGVAVVAVGNRRLLLGYGEQSVTMLTELAPAPAEPAAPLTAPLTTPLTGAAGGAPAAGVPTTLGALAAAVLPTPRGPRTPRTPRTTTVRTTPAAGGFADVLAAAERDATASPAPGAPATVPTASTVPAAPTVPVVSTVSREGGATGSVTVSTVDTSSDEDLLAPHDTVSTTPTTAAPASVPGGALHGSVLSPSTWKQAVAALRERTVRR